MVVDQKRIRISFNNNDYIEGRNPIECRMSFYGWMDYKEINKPINYIRKNYESLFNIKNKYIEPNKIHYYDVYLKEDYTINMVVPVNFDITVDAIKKECLRRFDYVKPEYWSEGWRKHPGAKSEIYTFPLHIALVLCWCFTNASLKTIGVHFGRDHATVLHAVRNASPSRIISNNIEFISGLNEMGRIFGDKNLADNFVKNRYKRKIKSK